MLSSYRISVKLIICLVLFLNSCSDGEGIVDPGPPEPGIEVVYLPVVVHVLHNGEEAGNGPNMTEQRIRRQIEILNEDFRRKEGTRGYNDIPSGGDAMIEFVLAEQNPDGKATNGINRINIKEKDVPNLGYGQDHYAQYVYWDSSKYINIWTTPLDESVMCLALGIATGPETDLPGTEFLAIPEPGSAEGILINWNHFGESDIDCHARYGRTLTHEMGHYLGLLHTWGNRDCEYNDFVSDTPPVDREVFGRSGFTACGEPVMIGNYMNYSDDIVMNIFTKGQIERMHYVLNHHEGRNSLITSPALSPPD
jgi:hypothetical protein